MNRRGRVWLAWCLSFIAWAPNGTAVTAHSLAEPADAPAHDQRAAAPAAAATCTTAT